MKILKVYDKINRSIFQVNNSSGDIIIKEYTKRGYCLLMINMKIFKLKNNTMTYLSYRNVVDNKIREELDLTNKYIQFKQRDENGLLTYSQRIHTKDAKSFLEIFRIYDENNEFIEIENHKGNKTIKFKIKEKTLNDFLKLI